MSELDRAAWEAICHWQDHVQIQTVRAGIDYAQLIRYSLWDKVSRAIRKKHDPIAFEFEADLLDPNWGMLQQNSLNPLKQEAKRIQQLIHAVQDGLAIRSRKSPTLYVPCEHSALRRTVQDIAHSVVTVVPYWAYEHQNNLSRFRPPLSKTRSTFALRLHQAVLEGLRAFEITLLDLDIERLKRQIVQVVTHIEQVKFELKALRPDVILLFADNHYPVQTYVFVAQQMQIPVIMQQHGLDCEQYCLEEAYAPIISVWGKARCDRYCQNSTWQPQTLQINGNPEFDTLRAPEKLDLNGDYWLWVTRPHRPEKCFSPSRSPREGIEILAALLQALMRSPSARLVIKPHPLDHPDLYQTYVNESNVRDRVEITTAPAQSLLSDASLVISEDSTVGLEAMFFGKVVVHAHFAASLPVLPFVKYEAALPGYSAEMLVSALEKQLSETEQQSMWSGQQRFIQDYAGLCDGQSHQRMVRLIQQVLQQSL
jgi:UDP-N-acetylglucosamine 2-epimerase